MQVEINAAQDDLPALIETALSGEEVIITKDGHPLAKLVPIVQKRFEFGLLEGKLKAPGPDFFEPMSEKDLALWEGGP